MFELDNRQRKYFGLDPVSGSWDKVSLKGDAYRPESILYFDSDTIKKHILSTETEYRETQFNERTENRELILPKTKKGRPRKLTASVLESRTPAGVYLNVNKWNGLIVGNHSTQTTFYSRDWEYRNNDCEIEQLINEFIDSSPENHFNEIEQYRFSKRKNIKYTSGDFFVFKINRTEYGFGRILFDVSKARKKKLLPDNHGLNLLMGKPLLIKMYAHKSRSKTVDLNLLKNKKALPSGFIMDNVVFYGEYEIIGNMELELHEFEFPMSYGSRLDRTPNVFLQWGLIHQELPKKKFDKYITAINEKLPGNNPSRQLTNPYGYYGIGFRPAYDAVDIVETIENNGDFNFTKSGQYRLHWDLRNPKNKEVRTELMKAFGLDPQKSYEENCKILNAINIVDMIKKMK